MRALDLEPHEQLDEIDRRTNEDGTVTVELLKWKKTAEHNMVRVSYRIPTGEVKIESMQWPEANDPEYKFIRLINQTPYTLRTAEKINDDNTLRLNANPATWDLDIPKAKKLRDYIPDFERGVGFEAVKFLVYPASLLAMTASLFHQDMTYIGIRDSRYDNTYLENRQHHREHIVAVKSALWLALWVLLFALIIL